MHYAMIKLSTTINNKQNIESWPQPNATSCYFLTLFVEACVACSNIGYRPLKTQKQELTPCWKKATLKQWEDNGIVQKVHKTKSFWIWKNVS
jgi:hypothetical protein